MFKLYVAVAFTSVSLFEKIPTNVPICAYSLTVALLKNISVGASGTSFK